MRIDGCVVLYRPTEENIANILRYAPLLRTLYVLDNSETPDRTVTHPLCAEVNISYVWMGGNRGIAAALRRGLEFAMREGADFCLTMDQDSAFPVERMGEIERWLSMPDIDDYGIIALNYEQSGGAGLVVVPTWITSGNFVNVRNYRLIAGFREELFIDSVDHELCHQFYCIGKKVAYIADIPMQHALGNMSYVSLFGRKLSLTNHSPLRYYYRFRNNYVLYREDKAFYRGLYRADRHQLIKIMLFEKNRREKWRMIRRGIRDAKRGVLGKYAP